jgi:hypothetical protein
VDQQHVILPQCGFSHGPVRGRPSLGRVVHANNDHPAAGSAHVWSAHNVDLLSLHGLIVSGVGIAGHDHWSSTMGTLVPATSGALIIVLL